MSDEEKKVISAMKKSKEPLKSGEIASATGLDAKQVGKIIDKLKKEGVVISPKRCFYSVA